MNKKKEDFTISDFLMLVLKVIFKGLVFITWILLGVFSSLIEFIKTQAGNYLKK